MTLEEALSKSTKGNQIGEQNSTAWSGVEDQPDSPDARDGMLLDLLRQAPGELGKFYIYK
jgi:hypothetical protein